MPIVSINLTEPAYKAYRAWRDHGRSASRKVSMAIERLWNQEETVPALQPGDRRTSVTGDLLEWTGEKGWKVIE